jgi:DNA repair protein RadC
MEQGRRALTDAELLAILIGLGFDDRNSINICVLIEELVKQNL